jgi:hypothetical protein
LPCTFQIPDHAGLKSTLALLSRTHHSAAAVFLNGPQHSDNPTAGETAPSAPFKSVAAHPF